MANICTPSNWRIIFKLKRVIVYELWKTSCTYRTHRFAIGFMILIIRNLDQTNYRKVRDSCANLSDRLWTNNDLTKRKCRVYYMNKDTRYWFWERYKTWLIIAIHDYDRTIQVKTANSFAMCWLIKCENVSSSGDDRWPIDDRIGCNCRHASGVRASILSP